MTTMTAYDSLNLFDKLAFAIRSIVMRTQAAQPRDNRSWVYQRAQERFEYLVEGGDLINLAPIPAGEPLVNVLPEHRDQLLALGAIERDGAFLMPDKLDDEEIWKFKDWFPRAPEDLESQDLNWHLTRDGKPTNGYIPPEDLVRSSDSTATSLLIGAFPVLFAAGQTLWQFPGVGPTAAMAVCGPLLALHAFALYQAEGAGTVAKAMAIGGGIPLLGAGFVGSGLDPATMGARGLTIGGLGFASVFAVCAVLAAAFKGPGKQSNLFSFFSRAKHLLMVVAAVYGLNVALSLLPSWLGWMKALGWYLPACAYPLYYTLGNFKARTAQLELQDKRGLGSTGGSSNMLGKRAALRMSQIRSAHRDKSPFMALGRAMGVMCRYDLALAPDRGQIMGITQEDAKTHLFILGKSGKGKTAKGIRKWMLELSSLPMPIGALGADGKWALVADTRDWWDLIIEAGVKFAPFQGMTSLQVARAFTEANIGTNDKESIWVQGAMDTHRYGLAILEALVAHEKSRRSSEFQRLDALEEQIDHWCSEKLLRERAGQDCSDIDAKLADLEEAADHAKGEVSGDRLYRWDPNAYVKLINIIGSGETSDGKTWRPSARAMALFDYLGFKSSEERKLLEPDTVHAHLADSSRVLSNSLFYFTETWFKGKTEEQRQSFLLNMDKDLQGFLQSDELRGHLIDGVDHGEEAWSHTEEGVDVMQCLYGKKVGLNLSDRYGKTAKVIHKLIQTRVYDALQERGEKYGDNWMEHTGQTYVVDLKDECQDLIGPSELTLSAKARSLGLSMVYATQSFESLNEVLGGRAATIAFLTNFGSRIVFQTSEATYEFLQGEAGPAKKKVLPVSVQATIDTSRAINALDNSIYSNPDHPSAWALRDMARRGSTRLQVVVQGVKNYMGMTRKVPIDEMDEKNFIEVHSGGEYKDGPILEMTDMTANLMEEGVALLYLNRANQPRIDFARMEHITTAEFARRLRAIRARQATTT